MNTFLQATAVFLPILYLLAATLYGMHFGGPEAAPAAPARRLRKAVLALALVLHLLRFAVAWQVRGGLPVNDPWSTLSLTALVTALLYGCIASWVNHAGTGGVVLGVVFLLQTLASAFGGLVPAPTDQPADVFGLVHGLTSTAAVAAVLLSGIHGALYLLLLRQLKGHRFGPLFKRLPDLDRMSRMTRGAAFAGFVLLTVGLNVGFFLAHEQNVAGFRYTDPWVLILLALWIHFGVVGLSSKIPGLSARRASMAAAAGFLVLIASVLLTALPAATFHWGT